MRQEQFGKLIEKRRLELGLSREDLARKMGVSAITVGRLEKAEVDDLLADNLYGLARALKWNPTQLFNAYHGREPGLKQDISTEIEISKAVEDFLELLPYELLERAVKRLKKK